jgi:hypothetical protein
MASRDSDDRYYQRMKDDPDFRARRNASATASKKRRKQRDGAERTARSLLYSRFDPELRRKVPDLTPASVPAPNAIPSITKAQLMGRR